MLNNDNSTQTKQIDTRRRFLKKAAIGAPIVLASSAKPAWGAACMSGIMSGNVSNHTHTCNLSGGLSHGYWKNHWLGSTKGDIKGSALSKEPYSSNLGQFYVKGSSVYLSGNDHKTDSTLPLLSHSTYIEMLERDGTFESEFVCAILNAVFRERMTPVYPYTLSDLAEILSQVTNDNRNDIADLLESIHKNGHSTII